jgi:integrase
MALKAIDVVAAGAGPVAANRARAYARACFAWACKLGILETSPFASLPTPSEEVSRQRVLSDCELSRVWRAAARLSPPWPALVQALILTGQRRSEIAGMEWSELSDDLMTFTIPAARSKNGVTHDVPMSGPMIELLKARPRLKDVRFVFSQGRDNAPNGFGRMKAALDAAACEPAAAGKPALPPLAPWTLHDLRRTLATGLQEMGVALPVTEAVLNHISGSRSGIVGIYQRHNYAAEKRHALSAWATRVLATVEGGEPGSNVIALPRAS